MNIKIFATTFALLTAGSTSVWSAAQPAALPAAEPAPAAPTDDAAPVVKPTASAPQAKGWKQTPVIEGLEHPWAVAFLPDDTMLITEREGRLRVARAGKLIEKPVDGVPPVLALRQGGLLDVVAHPKFAANKLIYLTYSHGTRARNSTRVARAVFDGTSLKDLTVLYEADTKADGFHFGSRLLFLPDGTLLVSVGDGFSQRDKAQDLGNSFGKVLRIKDDGTPAKDNPYNARTDAIQQIWTYGHRNIQGMAIDPATGNVWATEHGPLGGDELNLIIKGQNYGWPKATFGREYSGAKITDQRSMEGVVNARVTWVPCIAPSGLAFYTGDRFPQWKGCLFAGGLVAEEVRLVRLDGDRATTQETLKIGQRVRDVRQGPDGLLYILTDESKGRLIRIEPMAPDAPAKQAP